MKRFLTSYANLKFKSHKLLNHPASIGHPKFSSPRPNPSANANKFGANNSYFLFLWAPS